MHEADVFDIDVEVSGPFEQTSLDLPTNDLSGFEQLVSIIWVEKKYIGQRWF